MAFVYRSSKNLADPIKKQSNLPPLVISDETFPEITKKYYSKNNPIKHTIPFLTKTSKLANINKESAYVPGPGTYQIEDNFLKKTFNQNLTSPFDPESIEGGPSQLFISRERRFKNTNKTDNETPSPADYFYDENKKKFENKKNLIIPKSKVYKVFDPNRKISIPSDWFYFELKSDGEVEVKQDIKEITKKGNNTGPGSYNINLHNKNNNSIDWSRTVDDMKKNKNRNSKKEQIEEDKNNLRINTQVNTFNEFNKSINNMYYNEENNSTNGMNYPINKLVNKLCNTDISNLPEKNKNQLFIKTEDIPGPGDYDLSPLINVPICFSNVTNFGSNSSRGLLYPKYDNKLLIGHKDKKFKEIIKNINKSHSSEKKTNNEIKSKKKINKTKKLSPIYKSNSSYANAIKENNIINKKILMDQIGPGSYDPSTSFYKNKKDNDVQNFGSFEKRFQEKKDNLYYPGVGAYSLQNSYSKKPYRYIQSPVPPNITRKHSEGISKDRFQEMKYQIYSEKYKQPGVGDYFPEVVNSLDYNVLKRAQNSEKKPGFSNGEKRFFEFKKKYEDENQVGKYNLFQKEKKLRQQNSPFGSKLERVINIEGNLNKKGIGPGAYRYESYFDWNKKSYNILFN